MFEHKLEIAIITYNRHLLLDSTLCQLSKSQFRNVKITILDNHSSDRTPEVCQQYKDIFPNLTIIRRKKNIGGGPNFLRAIETSTSTYTWVLCDDDDYDFSSCDDIIDVILNESSDLIWVSNEHMESWEKGVMTTCDELLRRGARYYPALSFVPAVIFRTELFDGECLQQGYRYYENLYPQFHFIHKSFCQRYSIYVARNPIITRGWGSTGVSPFFQYAAWVKCCFSISDKYLRARAIEDLTIKGGGLLKEMFALVAVERFAPTFNPKRFCRDIILINLAFNLKQRLFFFIAFLPAIFLPKSFLNFLRKIRYRIQGKKFVHNDYFDKRDVYYD